MILSYRKSSYNNTIPLILFFLQLPLLLYHIITDFQGQVLYPRPDIQQLLRGQSVECRQWS